MKLDLCIALGLIAAEWSAPARKVNEMRNQVAHNLHAEFDSNSKTDLWLSLPVFLREAALSEGGIEVDERGEPNYSRIFCVIIL